MVCSINLMEQTIHVRSDQNNCNPLWRWSTLTSLVISLPLSIWQNCCLQYCSSASYAKHSVAWVRSVQLIVLFHSESEISKISILNFCWIESAHYSYDKAQCPSSTRWPLVSTCNFWNQVTRQSYAGHPRFYGFRTLGFLQFFLQQSLMWKLNHFIPWMSLVTFVPLILIFFFGEFSTCTNNSCLFWV